MRKMENGTDETTKYQTSPMLQAKSSEQNYITLAKQLSKDMVSVATCALKIKRTMCTALL